MTPRPIDNADLHAYVDGQLDPARRAAVEEWFADNPEAASHAAFYARLNETLHRRFDPILDDPIPPAMMRPQRWRLPPWSGSAALAASFLAAGLVGGWFAREVLVAPTIVERIVAVTPPLEMQAAVAHAVYAAEVRHPVEVGADEEAHLVRWLSNRLGHPIKAPRLEALGYRLMGGRLLPAASGGAAAQFMYEDARGVRITLFLRNNDAGQDETAFRFAVEENGVNVFYWIDRSFGCALSATLPREELLMVAREVYEQISD
jgi:anti-sigma factor RsiW